MELIDKIIENEKTIEKVIVTYHNGKTKDFNTTQWAYHESDLRADGANVVKDIKVINKQ